MAASKEQIEALKLIGDWSKWLIGVQTVGIGFVAALLKPDKPTLGMPTFLPPYDAKIAFVIGLVCFGLSLIAAGALQSGLPSAITDLNEGENLWDRGIYFLNRPYGEIWVAAEAQFALFLIGLFALAWSIYRLLL